MIKVIALFPSTLSPEKIDELTSKMIPAFRQAQGLISLTVSDGHMMSPGGPPPYSKVVEASFESLEVFMAWTQNPAAQADKDLIFNSGVINMYFETMEVM